MDSFAALALATERPHERLLKRLPINVHTARFLSNKMLKHIAGQATWQAALLLLLLYVPVTFSVKRHSSEHLSAIFNVFVFLQLFNLINCRKLADGTPGFQHTHTHSSSLRNAELNVFEGILKNRIFLAVIVFTIAGQIVIVEFGSTGT